MKTTIETIEIILQVTSYLLHVKRVVKGLLIKILIISVVE